MSAIQRGWERGRSVFDPSGDIGDITPGPMASAAAPDGADVSDTTDSMAAVDPDAVEAADTGTSADPGAGQIDGDGATGRTHRSQD
jgi:hypothetical protein